MPAKTLLLRIWVCTFLVLLSGCEQQPETQKSAKDPDTFTQSEIKGKPLLGKKGLKSEPQGEHVAKEPQSIKSRTKIVKKRFSSGATDTFATKSFVGSKSSDTSLTRAIWDYALESQETHPTVVVWVFDKTASAKKLRETVVSELKVTEPGPGTAMFESVVSGFSSSGWDANGSEPSSDKATLNRYLEQIGATDEEEESTFSNLVTCIEKFSHLRTTSRKTVMLVLVTDEAGDDPYRKIGESNAVDIVAEKLKQYSMPLFVIGYAAPFGRESDLVEGIRKKISYGPETAFPERVNLGMWNGSTDIFRCDSGFGPWNLERLCRESGGQFLAARPGQRSRRLVSKMQSNWPAVTSYQFSAAVMSSYKPYYGPLADYEKEIQSNKAKLALHNAAKLPHARVFRIDNYEFRQINEAAMVRSINNIQRIPAVIQPGLEKLYNILKTGEADRESLVSKRWEASFDLAYGRSMANYLRVIGLNSMLAELKRGKTFSNPESNSWILVPNIEVSTGTSNKRLAQKAMAYLNRVVDEHPGTPWALIAKTELQSPLGWKWEETKR